jgi:cbb3-type cytochrome oxidase subunit 3
MTADQWMGIAVGLVLLAFIAFAFLKGDKVKPSGRNPNDYMGSSSLNGGGEL